MTIRTQVGAATLALALVATMLAPPTVQSQTHAGTLSASLLRRLAEAADGYRTGEPIWVVASYAFPHDVAGVFGDSSRAVAEAGRLRGRGPYGVFGRFVTARDFERSPVVVMVGHMPPTIRDSLVSMPELPWLSQDVDSVTIVIHHGAQGAWRIVKQGLPDAVFFSLSAIDKFAIPYYTRLEGPASVAQWRESVGRQIQSHMP